MKKLQTNKSGFTIIEVLIVLAIAGLIMLIVFLAVPALQRNSRNTQRKNDAGALLNAVNEYATNNNGTLPATAQFNATGAFATTYPSLGIYTDATKVQWVKPTAATATAAPTGTDSITLAAYAKCNAAGTAAVTTNATARSVVAVFNIEGSNGSVAQCIEG